MLLITTSVPGQAPSPSAAGYTIEYNPAGPEWSIGQPLYQVFLHRYTPEGTIAAFRRELPALRDLGVGIIWLMPLHPMGDAIPGNHNPFRIKDHFGIDPGLGTPDEFRQLIRDIHRLGMRVIIGVVPNHTAYDHPLVALHPEYYRRTEEGGIANVGPWPHIAQLDYTHAEVRAYAAEYLAYWIEEFGVDGFRCDVAARIPLEFWEWVIPTIKSKYPGTFFLAESDEAEHHGLFDATYDWNTPPTLFNILHFDRPATSLDSVLLREKDALEAGAGPMRHMDNHDVHNHGQVYPYRKRVELPESFDADLYDKYGSALRVANVLYATLPGRYMIYNGQEIGYRPALPHNVDVPGFIKWTFSPLRAFYTELLRLNRSSPALHAGRFVRVPNDRPGEVFTFLRESPTERVFVAVNLSEQAVTIAADHLNDNRWDRRMGYGDRHRAGELILDGFGYTVLSQEPVADR